MAYKLQVTFDEEDQAAIERLKVAMGRRATAASVVREAIHHLDRLRATYESEADIGTVRNGKLESLLILPFDNRIAVPTQTLARRGRSSSRGVSDEAGDVRDTDTAKR